jgi:hypothetical protein
MSHFKLLNYAMVFEYWANQPLEVFAKAKEKAKKSKLDPSAAVRNRGDVCFPANSKHNKSSKDRYPINNEKEAHAALSYAGHYTSAPPWFVGGGLEALKNIVRRKVHAKFPKIEISDLKKSKK